MADLSALLTSSKALTSHLSKPDLPSINLSLDQIEAQSRRLVSKRPRTGDNDRANYLLAQAHVDAPALASSIAHLNTANTFSPLQALQDTDVLGYLRHAHEQNIISTIEEGRRQTQEEFYRVLEERAKRDWEAKKKRVFEELGGRFGGDMMALSVLDKKKGVLGRSMAAGGTGGPGFSAHMQSKMMAYDHVIGDMNASRLRGISYPIIHALRNATESVNGDSTSHAMIENCELLCKITQEPPTLPPPEHAGAHILNTPLFERKYARVYLGDPESREAIALRKQIARGAMEALEEQYWDVVERTIASRPMEARLGGDPSVSNKIRAYLLVRYYRGGEWEERIELVSGQPLWAKLFFLVRTGHAKEALKEVEQYQALVDRHETSFISHFRAWVESPDQSLPKPHRDHLQSVYNAHMLHSTSDPFKLALYKLMGKLDPSRRHVPLVTTTTEDWLWFQLAMLDEEENGGLRTLADVLLGYGEKQFEPLVEGRPAKRGVWAGVLLMVGEFERAVAALWDHEETEIEAVHLAIALAYHGLLRVPPRAETSDTTPLVVAPLSPPALSLSTLIWRYVRQFVKMDAKEALQYIYCVCLSSDQGDGVGREQLEIAWDLVRRTISLANSGAAWEALVGGFRPDGTRFTGLIEQGRSLLYLDNNKDFNEHILVRAARQAEENDQIAEAIKLYNLASDYNTVVSCLAQALGSSLSQLNESEAGRNLEKSAREILRHYERTNKAAGRDRDAVVRLLAIREAMNAKEAGRPEQALEIMESLELVPLDGDVAKITKRAEEFKDLHEALQRNLHTYLVLVMDALAAVHRKVKDSGQPDATKKMQLSTLRKKSRSLIMFAGMLKYRMSPDVYSYLSRVDVEVAL
ncbi:NIC-domain-containing protein [Gloeophyllum trabeum ATCC 11539]|uniref:Nuclear pore protein n=1 Tax=Gloeophyllum trabeum (strain ATCC 11539 / FP-39264 / Madison 617) TaxID=670483 RepID=S7QNQ7_GLOTA|nr:NIC-domain-containing protein [Gloeophyllum trabeum ATCC 11539]EPQ61191.1 NIC-domain-containing protein [Gloeophyllum trabeum ATCC 11539]